MIKLYKYENLGHVNHGWLDARHHFSFGSYRNPARLGFGDLIVINDDKVQAHKGFATHPHDNMEIITYVRSGAISHKDSEGNAGKTIAGDVQVMSAGTGIFHSEFNDESVDTTLFQIWIKPNKREVQPRWDARQFPKEQGSLQMLVSGREEDQKHKPLFIYADAAIYGGNIKAGDGVEQSIKHNAYILASKGSFEVNGTKMNKGDGAEVTSEKGLKIKALDDAEIIVIDVP